MHTSSNRLVDELIIKRPTDSVTKRKVPKSELVDAPSPLHVKDKKKVQYLYNIRETSEFLFK